MARLKKHGKELLRIEKEANVTAPEDSITWHKTTKTYHSDGAILSKYDVRFKPDMYRPAGELYSYGWKVYGKLKPGIDPGTYAKEKAQQISAAGTDSGWKVINGGNPVVIIDQDTIMRAIASGESIGFCKECGHEQDGCEPDARNYKCENCGAMAVYGAEEMLVG